MAVEGGHQKIVQLLLGRDEFTANTLFEVKIISFLHNSFTNFL